MLTGLRISTESSDRFKISSKILHSSSQLRSASSKISVGISWNNHQGCVKYVDQMEQTHGFPYTGPLAGNQLDQASQALMGLIQLIHVLDAPQNEKNFLNVNFSQFTLGLVLATLLLGSEELIRGNWPCPAVLLGEGGCFSSGVLKIQTHCNIIKIRKK